MADQAISTIYPHANGTRGEEKKEVEASRFKPTRPIASVAARRILSSVFREALGLPEAWEQTDVLLEGWHRMRSRKGWCSSADERLTNWHVEQSLGGRFGLALLNLQQCAALIFDFDFQHAVLRRVKNAPRRKVDLSEEPSDRLRKRRSPRVGETRALRKIRAAFPSVHWHAVSSKRGVHVVAILDQAIAVADIAELGRRVLDAAGLRKAPIEVFPTSEGRTCRLPLTGCSRLLTKGLTRGKHKARNLDLRELLAAPRASLEDFTAIAATENGGEPAHGNPSNILCVPPEEGEGSSSRVRSAPKRGALEDGAGETEIALDEHLFGRAFTRTMLRVAKEGIPTGQSWNACRKIAFALHAVGVPRSDSERLFEDWIELPIHRAEHCQSAAGRAQLAAQFRACLSHQEQTEGGKAKRSRLAQLPALMAGRKVRPDEPVEETATVSYKRSLAALRRWHPDRFPPKEVEQFKWRTEPVTHTCAHRWILVDTQGEREIG